MCAVKEKIKYLAIGIILVLVLTPQEAAAASLDSYTYSEPGTAQPTPDPYTLSDILDLDEAGGLNGAQDLCMDEEGWLYIADTGNNRVLVLDDTYKLVADIREYSWQGRPCAFRSPGGVYVSKKGELYVADTQNGRIAVFSREGEFSRVIGPPQADTLRKDFVYQPVRLAVSDSDYVYAVGTGMVEGIAEFNAQGEFVRFAACNETKPNLLEYFWTRTLATQAHKEISALFLSEEFNSLAIDEEGFFMTVSTTAGVRRFNAKGNDITKTTGSFLLVGDYKTTETADAKDLQSTQGDGVSKLTDIAVGKDGIYSVIDEVYQRIFTYDYEGNLLWAFGREGTMDGAFKKLAAIAYDHEDRLLVLDSELGRINRFSLTEFGRQAQAGARLRYAGRNKEAAEEWAAILDYDANYPLAYLGKGILAYESGDYFQAMENFRLANSTEQYSKAFVRYRREMVNRWFPYVMTGLLGGILLLAVIVRLIRRRQPAHGRPTFYTDSSALTLPRQLRYARYTVFHPFKAFWDMKSYKKTSVLSATLLLALLVAVNTLKAQSTGFLFNTTAFGQVSVFKEIRTVFLVVILWCAANWALTTLMDGEGTFRQIYIMTAYAAAPLILTQLFTWLFSHVLSLSEGAVLTVVSAAGMLLTGFLLFIGTTVTHQYTVKKNIASLFLTLVAIAAILFLAMIALEMTDWVLTFIETLGKEIALSL